ncbi:MAG: type I glutamate--ammonia ligase [Candidatus Aenigmarchaeota archaeon]|nr:type I glutamate--ammonia ligase [Candidatus Aenigmarchaeota archaeon]
MIEKTKLAKLQEENNDIKYVDFKFVDLPGQWQHFTVPIHEFIPKVLEKGIGFDGSSIRGFQGIEESDMMLMPDANSAFIDQFSAPKTISLICSVTHPITNEPYSRDPRGVAKRAEEYLKKSGIATHSFWGPELEGFAFNSLRFSQGPNFATYDIDSEAGIWNSGKEGPNLAHRPRHKEGYFPTPPLDKFQNWRNKVVDNLEAAGISVERQHHEVATGGQFEIDFRYGTLLKTADNVLLYKHILKNTAKEDGLVVTFMPKPLFGDNGSGMHTHQSLWNETTALFYEEKGEPFHLSKIARSYIAGLLAHSPALMAFCAPTTNSYKRLVPGYEAPVNLCYSARNRSAAIRIPTYDDSPNAIRLEFRPPDPSCNPYLAFSAMLMAGMDGIMRGLDPGKPLNKNTYELTEEEKATVPTVPGSLDESLKALEKDHEFLLKGGVFTADLIETWIKHCKEKAQRVSLRPNPAEFMEYSDV